MYILYVVFHVKICQVAVYKFCSVHQEYINMIRDFEQCKSPGGNDNMLSKLRQRLKEKEKALEVGIPSFNLLTTVITFRF